MHSKFHGLIAKALELEGFKPIIFTVNKSYYSHQCFKLFGIKNLVKWDKFLSKNTISSNELDRILKGFSLDKQSIITLKNLKHRNVDVGKHALSMTCRRLIEGKLDFTDQKTFNVFKNFFKKAILNTEAAYKFFENYNIKKLLVRDAGYLPNGPIYEVALNRGVDCIVFDQGQKKDCWVFKRMKKQTKGMHYFSLSPETWSKVKNINMNVELDFAVEQEFINRYDSNSKSDIRRLQSGKSIKQKKDIELQLGLDPNKKTAIIFSHIAWDAAFFYGESIFDDFEDWLYETVKFVAKNCTDINWIVKIHPFNSFKLQREKVQSTSEMRLLEPLFPIPDHIKILQPDTDINTKSFFNLADYVLTVNGTVGMEFPCFGVPVILAGTGRYNGFGFTYEPKNRVEYFKKLKNLSSLPRLDSKQIELARKHFYFLIKGKQISFEDVAPMEILKLHEAQNDLHDNIQINVKNLKDFNSKKSIGKIGKWIAQSNEPDVLNFESVNG